MRHPIGDQRRERLFERCCVAFLCVSPLFFWMGALQGGFRGQVVFGTVAIAVLGSMVAWYVTRRGYLDVGIHIFCGNFSIILLVGAVLSGRVPPAAYVYVIVMVVAGLHRRASRIFGDLAVVLGCLAYITIALPPMYATQVPVLITVLLFTALVMFFSARVNNLDAEDLRAANVQLLALNDALDVERLRSETANEAKSMFLATMSHELRTPLTTVLGYTEMVRQALRDSDFDSGETDADLAVVEVAAGHLLKQVSRILDLTRIEGGSSQSSFALAPLIEEIASQHGSATTKQVDLRTCLPNNGRMTADRARIAMVLGDLLDNALRFTTEGVVEIGVRQSGGSTLFWVEDTGIGIAEADHPKVFDLFTQIDGSFTRKVDGVGLGLPLCKRLASGLGAKLTMRSELGVGTRFELLFC